MKYKDGGAAFPEAGLSGLPNGEFIYGRAGMTLRDYFAAKAMQAAATNQTGADGFTFTERARWAYNQADAMLEAREA